MMADFILFLFFVLRSLMAFISVTQPLTETRSAAPETALHVILVTKQEAQLMLTTGAMRLAVSRGQQTWYHFGSVATFR